jgi:hypothetical protein
MAGVDQGASFIFTDGQLDTFPRAYLTGLGFEGGFGRPTQTPGTSGLFEAVLINLPDNSGLRTNQDRPTLVARPAGTEQGVVVASFADHTTSMIDWWEKVHVLPRTEIAFGNIITQKQEDYEMYSAHREVSITLDSITNNATPGVSLPDESTPEVVPRQTSMLDAATTDNLSDTLALGTMVKREVIAAQNGLATFDTTLDFSFDSSDAPQLFISGTRIVLMPTQYEAPVKETLAFLTDIITALSGKEQRIALRKQPRQIFEVIYKLTTNERQRMQAFIMDWTDNVFGFPVWDEALELTAAVSSGATVYPVTNADEVDLRLGGLAVIITDANTFDVITIDSLTATTITATDASVNAYPVGTLIMPLRAATVLGTVAAARAQNNLETFKIRFEVNDNDTGALAGSTAAYSTYNGRVLFDDCNVVSGEMAEEYKRRIYRIDNSTGLIALSSTWDRNKRHHQKGFVLRSRLETLNFRRVLIALAGRQKAFYTPTWIEDLEVKADLVSAANTMDIENIEYERFINARAPKDTFRITFTDGTSLVRIVQSVANVDTTTERLTLDTTWPANRTVAEIVRVQFYELGRFGADNFVINHPRVGLATCQQPVVQVFDDN